jgi:hypothetical protein
VPSTPDACITTTTHPPPPPPPPAAAGAGPSSDALQQVQIITPAALNLPSNLPASVAAQIRRAQAKAALAGQAPAAWAVGAAVHALYSADGQYYPATVQGVGEGGKFVVLYEGYGNTEEVRQQQWRPHRETAVAVAVANQVSAAEGVQCCLCTCASSSCCSRGTMHMSPAVQSSGDSTPAQLISSNSHPSAMLP